MEAAIASQSRSEIADTESVEAHYFDAEKFFAEARQRMAIRLQKIRGEEMATESKMMQQANDFCRS